MGKKVDYKNLILLLPIIGFAMIIILMLFKVLRAKILVGEQLVDTFEYSGWDLIFASKTKGYYTGIGWIFLTLFIVVIALFVVSNSLAYVKSEKNITVLPKVGFVVIPLCFIAFVVVAEVACFNTNKEIYTADNIWMIINSEIVSLPIWFMLFVFIAFGFSNYLTLSILKNQSKQINGENYYEKMFFINLLIYLVPLFILILVCGIVVLIVLLIGAKGGSVKNIGLRSKEDIPFISADKKTVILGDKKYKLHGDRVFDNFVEIGKIKDDKFVKKENRKYKEENK